MGNSVHISAEDLDLDGQYKPSVQYREVKPSVCS